MGESVWKTNKLEGEMHRNWRKKLDKDYLMRKHSAKDKYKNGGSANRRWKYRRCGRYRSSVDL